MRSRVAVDDPQAQPHLAGHHPYPTTTDLAQVPDLLREFGVCVIPDVFSANECAELMHEIVFSIEKLCPGVKRRDPSTWTRSNLIPCVRHGLFQIVLNNLQPVWRIRRDERIREIFAHAYSGLRGRADLLGAKETKKPSATSATEGGPARRPLCEEEADGDRTSSSGAPRARKRWSKNRTSKDDEAGMVASPPAGADSTAETPSPPKAPLFVCSLDGINIQQNDVPYEVLTGKAKDWPHLDQTLPHDPYLCVQGQVLLTNSTASFRCTPKSHLKFAEILAACGVAENSTHNWLKFTDEQVELVQTILKDAAKIPAAAAMPEAKMPASVPPGGEAVHPPESATAFPPGGADEAAPGGPEAVSGSTGSTSAPPPALFDDVKLTSSSGAGGGGALVEVLDDVDSPLPTNWQIPIRASRGSVILWTSSTIHSAMSSQKKEQPCKQDPWLGWRGVVYVCYRPFEEFSRKEIELLEDLLRTNRGTNHWATKVSAAKGAGARFQTQTETVKKLTQDPERAYEILGWRPPPGAFLIE